MIRLASCGALRIPLPGTGFVGPFVSRVALVLASADVPFRSLIPVNGMSVV